MKIKCEPMLIAPLRGMPTRDEILANSHPFAVCGVYFLIKDDEIVYVGKSRNVYKRITTHTMLFDFDRVTILEMDDIHCRDAEAIYIQDIRPRLNIVQPPVYHTVEELEEAVSRLE